MLDDQYWINYDRETDRLARELEYKFNSPKYNNDAASCCSEMFDLMFKRESAKEIIQSIYRNLEIKNDA